MKQNPLPRMPRYFLCYRRDDAAGHAGRLYGDLARAFDREAVFFDLRSIPPGEDFREVVRGSITACSAVLVLIGQKWQSELLDNDNDYVRFEIETALIAGKRVVPVLVQGALMPEPGQLPVSIRALGYRHASEISDRHWDADLKDLICVLRRSPRGPRRWTRPLLAAGFAIATAVVGLLVGKSALKETPGVTGTVSSTQTHSRSAADHAKEPGDSADAPSAKQTDMGTTADLIQKNDRVFYRVDTYARLRAENLIEYRSGLRRVWTLASKLDDAKFKEAGMYGLSEIEIGAPPERVRVITIHDQSSYSLIRLPHDQTRFRIEDHEKFWAAGRHLVIAVP